MPSAQNQTELQLIKDKLSTAKSVAVVDYSGTSVNDQVDLRRGLKGAGSELFVTKNTLINLATDGKLKDSLKGMNALVLSYDDEVGGLKVLFDWQGKNEKLIIKLGLLGDAVLSEKDIKALSKLPGKMELISILIARLNGPASGLVNVMKAGIRDLANVMRAIEKQQAAA